MPCGLVLAHGAGSDRNAPLLLALDRAFSALNWRVERINLPFRELRPHGPPGPRDATRDQEGIRKAISAMRTNAEPVFAGGHSYGGRQASMLVSEEPALVAGLLLLSYPLHPPRRPLQLRTAHLEKLGTPALFVHGSRDPFGSIAEIRAALELIPAKTRLIEVEGAGHDVAARRVPSLSATAERIATEFASFVG